VENWSKKCVGGFRPKRKNTSLQKIILKCYAFYEIDLIGPNQGNFGIFFDIGISDFVGGVGAIILETFIWDVLNPLVIFAFLLLSAEFRSSPVSLMTLLWLALMSLWSSIALLWLSMTLLCLSILLWRRSANCFQHHKSFSHYWQSRKKIVLGRF
jgi:hypothetical protein